MAQDNGSPNNGASINPPADVIRDGNLKASIWRNESENGSFYATTFSRSYKDREGQYRETNSFVAADLLKLSKLADQAYERTNDLRREDREQGRGQSREQNPDQARLSFRESRMNTPTKDRSSVRGR
jgi:hypothetical protein